MQNGKYENDLFPCCCDCTFWSNETGDRTNGTCNRNAPKPKGKFYKSEGEYTNDDSFNFPLFPKTDFLDFCGEWIAEDYTSRENFLKKISKLEKITRPEAKK